MAELVAWWAGAGLTRGHAAGEGSQESWLATPHQLSRVGNGPWDPAPPAPSHFLVCQSAKQGPGVLAPSPGADPVHATSLPDPGRGPRHPGSRGLQPVTGSSAPIGWLRGFRVAPPFPASVSPVALRGSGALPVQAAQRQGALGLTPIPAATREWLDPFGPRCIPTAPQP